jgi:hypothetical protein
MLPQSRKIERYSSIPTCFVVYLRVSRQATVVMVAVIVFVFVPVLLDYGRVHTCHRTVLIMVLLVDCLICVVDG